MSIFNHCEWKSIEFGEKKRKIRVLQRWRSLKFIKVGTNRKPVCDFLLVTNNNWHPISYRFGVIAAYCSNFGHFAFLSHPLGLRNNVRCSSWAHWKARSRLLIGVNWTFFARCYGWVATNENRSKIGDFAPSWSVWSKISGIRGRHPSIIFARIVRPMNALQLFRWQFSHKETLLQTFFKRSAIVDENWPFCVFEPQFGELRGNVRWSS